MRHAISLPNAPRFALVAGGLALLLAAAIAVWAQVSGERGIAPVAASSDIQVSQIEVDARGDSPEDAREKGWKEAQRIAWERLDGPQLSDSQIEGLVSAIVIERERLGPRRYIATLGVIFDRERVSGYLGSGERGRRSAPMLLIPVTATAGSNLVYEMRNPWQRAWAEFQAGSSRINYVRPSGAGGDSLLITYGQTGRRSRTWWRNILDQFGAADVLVPVARLDYRYPGGPIEGQFTARYGPDNRYLDAFTLTAEDPEQLPDMLEQAVERFDAIFEAALADGKLRPDPTLDIGSGETDPAIARLIELGRALRAREQAAAEAPVEQAPVAPATPETPTVVNSYVVQFASPDGAAVDATIATVRSTAGVRAAVTTSLAIGGTSVMRVSYTGSLDELAAALQARGYNVRQGSNALAISR